MSSHVMLFSVLGSLLALEERAAMTWFSIYYSKFLNSKLIYFFFLSEIRQNSMCSSQLHSRQEVFFTSLHSVSFL